MKLLSTIVMLPLAIAIAGATHANLPARPTAGNDLPRDPSDERVQTSVNVSAYLMCSCLFVERSTESACRSDLIARDADMTIAPDKAHRLVRIAKGRWVGIARLWSGNGGCRLD